MNPIYRDAIGYAYKKPMPTAIKTFNARKGRFVHIVNKELDFDWDKEVDLISAQGPAARTMQHMMGAGIGSTCCKKMLGERTGRTCWQSQFFYS